MSERFSVRFDFLDKQLVDADGLPIGRVDDLELELESGGEGPVVTNVLTGAEALGQRLGGVVGSAVAAAAGVFRAARAEPGPARIDASLVASAGTKVELTARFEELPGVAELERWLSSRVIARLPRAGG